jgi:hypothetical protein
LFTLALPLQLTDCPKGCFIKGLNCACHLQFLAKLIEEGANLHMLDSRGYTALHYAALGGNIDTFEYLLKVRSRMSPSDSVRACFRPLQHVQSMM